MNTKNYTGNYNELWRWIGMYMILTFHTSLFCQSPYKVKHFTTEDGLPQNTVTCIMKDSRGFLWFGTPNGLCRFDGYQVKVYKSAANNKDIRFKTINSICEDDNRNLWIGGDRGLMYFLFQQEKLLAVNVNQTEISQQAVKSVWSHGNIIWVASETGLYQARFRLMKEKAAIHLDVFSTFLNDLSVNTITDTRNYGLLFGTIHGLYRYDSISREIRLDNKVNLENASFSGDIRTIYEALDKTLWIGTFFGLYHYSGGSHETKLYLHNPDNTATINHSTIRAIAEDSKGNLLIGTLGGLDIYDPLTNSFQRFSNLQLDDYNLNNIFVSSLCTDPYGNVWIGTDKGGLNHYNVFQKPFYCFIHNPRDINSLSHNTINSIIEKAGTLWIGTAGGGLNRLNLAAGKYLHYKFDPHDTKSVSSNFISTLFFDSQKNLWIGTWGGGINELKHGQNGYFQRFSSSPSPYSLSNNFVSSIIAYNEKYLAIGTEGGLNFYNVQSGHFIFFNIPAPDKSRITEVGCLLKDKKENLWIGTRNGLYKLSHIQLSSDVVSLKAGDIAVFKETENTNGLKGNYVTAMIEASNDILWIGTYGNGINKCYRSPSGDYHFEHFSELDGLCNDAVYRIEEDNSGKLWISTDNGLSRFDPATGEFKNFYQNDGLLSSQFYWSASFHNSEGKLYFGGVAGLNYFEPVDMIDYPFMPEVTFTDFKIFNESVAIGQKRNHRIPIKKSISATENIEVSYRDNVLSIEFAALNHFLPDKTTYAYKMDGMDKDWVYVPSSRRFATYTNLKGGSYTFRVKAINSDGISSYTPKELIINIIPPFWEAWWFRIWMVCMVILAVLGYVKYRTHYLHEQKATLEKLVNERTAKIDEQKKKLELQANNLLNINKELEIHQQQIEGQKQELEKKNSKILQQRDELIILNRKVQQVNQLRLRFFTNISHEFRTPLTLILGPLESLSKHIKIDTEGSFLFQTIQRNAQRLLHLINQLMLFRRLEEGKMKLQVSRHDMVAFVNDLFHSFDDLAQKKNIAYHLQIDEPPSETWFDEEKLEIILFNLLSNAFKYTPDKGKIEISLSFESAENSISENGNRKYVNISIKDSGIGISPENISKIFSRFYRADAPENQKISGTGLGLTFTRELVDALHGNIAVTSDPGHGTTFTIRIPFTRECFSEKERSPVSLEKQFDLENQLELLKQEMVQPEQNLSETNGILVRTLPSVLIVEDSYDLRSFIVKSFKNDYRMLEAANGKEAFILAKKHSPDLIISDVMMPVMDGLELCSRIKKNLATSHIPVILLTAKALLENWIEGLETGADDYIPKPFNINVLHLKVRNIIESRKRLKELFKLDIKPDISVAVSNPLDENFLNKAYELLENNYHKQEFDLDFFAGEMFMSRSLFYKKLKSLTGYTVVDFITLYRLKKSLELIARVSISIAEAAITVGFNDPKYFSRVFRKVYGVPPTEYMKSQV